MSGRKSQDDSDRNLDFLLAGGKLSGPANERLRSVVLDATATARGSRWPGRFGVGLVGLAAGALLLVGGASLLRGPHAGRDAALVAKGEGQPVSVLLDCSGGSDVACPKGSRLLLGFSGIEGPAYLAGYATVDGDGEKRWYFHGRESFLLEPVAGSRTRLSSRAVIVDDSHSAGHFTVQLFLTRSPVAPEDLALLSAGDVIFRAELPLTITERP